MRVVPVSESAKRRLNPTQLNEMTAGYKHPAERICRQRRVPTKYAAGSGNTACGSEVLAA